MDRLGAPRRVFEGQCLAVIVEIWNAHRSRVGTIAPWAAHVPGRAIDVSRHSGDGEDHVVADLGIRRAETDAGVDGAVAHEHRSDPLVGLAVVVVGRRQGDIVGCVGVERITRNRTNRTRRTAVVGVGSTTLFNCPLETQVATHRLRARAVEDDVLGVERDRRRNRKVSRH